MFRRFCKTLAALLASHGIQTLSQLLLPPAFILAYGVRGYGVWLVLAATVGYLTTLDFGLQTYVVNELTMLYHRQDWDQFHRVQSVGMRLMLGLVGCGAALSATVFALPVAEMLKTGLRQTDAAWTLFWLAFQILMGVALGQILGIYRAIGHAHVGVMWFNLQRILSLAVTLSFAWFKSPFWTLALGQALTFVLVLTVVLASLKTSSPTAFPRLDYWDRLLAWRMLKPSAFFGLFIVNQFLVFQAPILILNRFLGSEVVVIFTVARTLFSFVRQAVSLVQHAIAPEVTRLNGIGDGDKLVRIYLTCESAVLAAALVINVGLLLIAPAILSFWLNRPGLFEPTIFLSVMVSSILLGLKDFKVSFQYSTNNHVRSAIMTFACYAAMIVASIPVINRFGLTGFLVVWPITELVQIAFAQLYNRQFSTRERRITAQPAIRLALVMAIIVPVLASARAFLQSPDIFWHGVAAASAMSMLAVLSYFLFGLHELKGLLGRLWLEYSGARRQREEVEAA
jgi:O-antigen/teichoic acid export membrane protein